MKKYNLLFKLFWPFFFSSYPIWLSPLIVELIELGRQTTISSIMTLINVWRFSSCALKKHQKLNRREALWHLSHVNTETIKAGSKWKVTNCRYNQQSRDKIIWYLPKYLLCTNDIEALALVCAWRGIENIINTEEEKEKERQKKKIFKR